MYRNAWCFLSGIAFSFFCQVTPAFSKQRFFPRNYPSIAPPTLLGLYLEHAVISYKNQGLEPNRYSLILEYIFKKSTANCALHLLQSNSLWFPPPPKKYMSYRALQATFPFNVAGLGIINVWNNISSQKTQASEISDSSNIGRMLSIIRIKDINVIIFENHNIAMPCIIVGGIAWSNNIAWYENQASAFNQGLFDAVDVITSLEVVFFVFWGSCNTLFLATRTLILLFFFWNHTRIQLSPWQGALLYVYGLWKNESQVGSKIPKRY